MRSDEKRRIRRYEVYNLLYWIKSSAPDSQIAKEAFDRYQKDNPDFLPREYPDLDHWSSGATLVKPESPISAKDLIAKPPQDSIELLLSYKRDDDLHYDWDREGLLKELSKAVLSSFDWSLRMAKLLAQKGEWKSDVWEHLIRGWEQSILSEAQWIEVIRILNEYPKLHTATIGAADLLKTSIKRSKDETVHSILPELEQLSDKIWDSVERMRHEEEGELGWLQMAINHPAGKLAEFWLQALSRRRNAAKDGWSNLPPDYKTRFKKIIAGESYAGQLARVVVSSRIHFLFYLDPRWTQENLLPLLDYNLDELRAEQAWHGFLYWGRIPSGLEEDFKPLLLKAVECFRDDKERLRERLFTYIADLVLKDPENPLEDGWFYDILRNPKTTTEDKLNIAGRVWHTLRDANDEFKESIWRRWLKHYWSDRIENIPVSLSAEEADEFIQWAPSLQPVFPEAVNLIRKMKAFKLHQTFLYLDLEKNKLADRCPEQVLQLLIHVLKDAGDSTLHCYDLVPLHKTLKKNLSSDRVRPLTERLTRLGCA